MPPSVCPGVWMTLIFMLPTFRISPSFSFLSAEGSSTEAPMKAERFLFASTRQSASSACMAIPFSERFLSSDTPPIWSPCPWVRIIQ